MWVSMSPLAMNLFAPEKQNNLKQANKGHPHYTNKVQQNIFNI